MQPYQYQIAGITFGRNTNIPISKVDIQPYNVNVQDFQVPLTDENRFGIDTLVPGPIVFTMAIIENHMLEQFADVVPVGFESEDLFALRGTVLGQMARVWKAKEVRAFWGAVVPLLYCTSSGEVVRIYGRPGKFQYMARTNDRTQWIDVQAEFRRADTFAHGDIEYFVGDPVDAERGMSPDEPPVTIERGAGDADSWVRILIQGPASHPVINYGDNVIEMDLNLPAGRILEISSYPWQRRVVDSVGANWRAKLIGDTKYLEEIVFPHNSEIDVSWTCTGATTDTQMFFMWREAYNVT
ncbi:minor tail protein [Mycobacterium phage Onyinye]|uniref:Minor tail protein n=1 Tax=Mycobacterium phage Onyinye TaxID=2686235 RepID=A0A6B9LHY0_9CAUD|nr:minor tail protein [Mycobacterium phage Onyinye]QHB37444.1 minor tail protein [Mycobacterium phage Onyinye]